MSQTSELLKTLIRTEPIQRRSSERIDRLLDTAAAIVAERGIEGLTTTDVAARSGSSVGVVYRYFPNIRSLLRALAARNLMRYTQSIEQALPEGGVEWIAAIDVTIDQYVRMMRAEPGFRAIRFGDLVDQRLLEPDVRHGSMLSQVFMSMLSEKYGFERTDRLVFSLEVAVEIADALLVRAFQQEPDGDTRFIDRTRELAHAELAWVTQSLAA